MWRKFRKLSPIQYFIPPDCYHKYCFEKRWGTGLLCLTCLKKIWKWGRELGVVAGYTNEEKSEFNWEGSIFKKDDLLMPLIYGLKYQGQKRNARFLTEFLRFDENKITNLKSYDVIAPVPLHPIKKRERGFNQSEVIAETLGRVLNMKVERNLLKRVKYTGTQTKLGRRARWDNMKSSFKMGKALENKNKQILIVDDVFTTGSTLQGCAVTLKKSGYENIGGFTLVGANKEDNLDDFQRELDMVSGFLA